MTRLLVMYGLFRPSATHLARMRERVEVIVAEDEASAARAAADAEIIFGHRFLRQTLPHAPRLRWVQSTAGGVDTLPCRELKERGVTLTRVTFTAPVIARHAVTLAWALNRGLPAAFRNQTRGEWETKLEALPQPRRAAVFGTGAIGRSIAARLRADGIAVDGIRRRIDGAPLEEFNSVRVLAESAAALAQADWCFLALPENPETRGYFNAARLALLPKHAVLVNVGRGSTVVTEDLCAALRAGQLGGAALDVMDPKPSGPSDPVWRTPRLVITPHVAAHYVERQADMEVFAETQLDRFLRGEALENRVDFSTL